MKNEEGVLGSLVLRLMSVRTLIVCTKLYQ